MQHQLESKDEELHQLSPEAKLVQNFKAIQKDLEEEIDKSPQRRGSRETHQKLC